jgi:hypothetical protein
MPYLIMFTKWPSDKTVDVIKKVYEANKKFPPDESLGIDLTPGNAIKATKDGFETIGVQKVIEGKLEESYHRVAAIGNLYAMAIEGFEYKLEVWSNEEEAYSTIGQKPPE